MHVFRSRVSVALLLLILVSILPAVLIENPNPDEALLGYGILAISLGFVMLVLFVMRYQIGEKELVIKLGPFKYSKMDISDIEKVERSYNPLSSPASSLKRLYVKSKGKDVLISPKNEAEFVRLLKARNPKIEVNISDKEGWWRFWDWDV